jgi:hypothetical protein
LLAFKFVDRTFNLNLETSRRILGFFLEHYHPGLFLHFEMIPDRLPEPLRALLAAFPPGTIQLEIGIQSFNPDVNQRIRRRQNNDLAEQNLSFLRRETGVHLHTDLIAGLPGESLESFGAGFDRLVALRPHEIQVGILKRLRGTPITRHDAEWEMVYSPEPPYEIVRNRLLDFNALQRIRRFARFWDLAGNSGRLVDTIRMLWEPGLSPFLEFMRWSDWLFARLHRTHEIPLQVLAASLHDYLVTEKQVGQEEVLQRITTDFQRSGARSLPDLLRQARPAPHAARPSPRRRHGQRQSRHSGTPWPLPDRPDPASGSGDSFS